MRRDDRPDVLLAAARSGDRGATGRLLSLVERGGVAAREVGRLTFEAGIAVDLVIGITGAPGAGKSTLTSALVTEIRQSGSSVGVLAVDPSSPFSGGAILGDRIRMGVHSGDDGVFIRSMATRGHLGGLALAAPEAVRVLAAVGRPIVLIETVGVGQVEVEVAGATDTTLVVVTPGWGDSIQANKAGLLEIADIFVVNKADRPGAAETTRDLESMLDLGTTDSSWRPPVIETVSTSGRGIDELWTAVGAHRDHVLSNGELAARRRRRLVDELDEILMRRLTRDARSVAGGRLWESVTERVVTGALDPWAAADEVLGVLVPPQSGLPGDSR